MDPSRKRKLRLVVALSAALILAGVLVYTSFSASTEASTPSELVASAEAGRSYEVTGKVAKSSVTREDDRLRFVIRDRDGAGSVPVTYEGAVPDPFREGREVIITVRRQGTTFVGERDSLVTKCPSKFTTEQSTA